MAFFCWADPKPPRCRRGESTRGDAASGVLPAANDPLQEATHDSTIGRVAVRGVALGTARDLIVDVQRYFDAHIVGPRPYIGSVIADSIRPKVTRERIVLDNTGLIETQAHSKSRRTPQRRFTRFDQSVRTTSRHGECGDGPPRPRTSLSAVGQASVTLPIYATPIAISSTDPVHDGWSRPRSP